MITVPAWAVWFSLLALVLAFIPGYWWYQEAQSLQDELDLWRNEGLYYQRDRYDIVEVNTSGAIGVMERADLDGPEEEAFNRKLARRLGQEMMEQGLVEIEKEIWRDSNDPRRKYAKALVLKPRSNGDEQAAT